MSADLESQDYAPFRMWMLGLLAVSAAGQYYYAKLNADSIGGYAPADLKAAMGLNVRTGAILACAFAVAFGSMFQLSSYFQKSVRWWFLMRIVLGIAITTAGIIGWRTTAEAIARDSLSLPVATSTVPTKPKVAIDKTVLPPPDPDTQGDKARSAIALDITGTQTTIGRLITSGYPPNITPERKKIHEAYDGPVVVLTQNTANGFCSAAYSISAKTYRVIRGSGAVVFGSSSYCKQESIDSIMLSKTTK